MGQKIDLNKYRSIGNLSEGYKRSTRTTIKDDRGSRQVEHFDGRVDAEVRPQVVKIGTHQHEGAPS